MARKARSAASSNAAIDWSRISSSPSAARDASSREERPLSLEQSGWQRWVQAPQQLRWRRALFQVHLWIGIALGAYIVVISVSGSAIVFRRELNAWLVPRTVPSTAGVRLTADELLDAARRAYPEYEVKTVREQRRPERPVLVSLERNGKSSERLFDPYAGVDMGHSYPPTLRAVEWLVDLHDNLLAGATGRFVNGLAGILLSALFVSGAVLWWPGRRRWRQSLAPGAPEASRRFTWRLHSALGFWSFGLLFVWAITAAYFAFPEPVEAAIDWFDSDLSDSVRPGEPVLLALIQLHFGRFGGLGVRFLWVVLGLLPAALFVTGFVLWWTRVARRRVSSASGAGVVFRERGADHAT
jgi:uncharacterized iron-regulated membrane protein